MTTLIASGLYVWTITLENGTVRTSIGSSLGAVTTGILPSPVVSAVRGAAVVAGPAPIVTGLVPATAAVGAASFTLKVNGTGFTPGCTIVFNGQDEPTTFVSATEVTTGVNMAVWTAPSAPLPVKLRTLDGRESNAMSFTFTATAEE